MFCLKFQKCAQRTHHIWGRPVHRSHSFTQLFVDEHNHMGIMSRQCLCLFGGPCFPSRGRVKVSPQTNKLVCPRTFTSIDTLSYPLMS